MISSKILRSGWVFLGIVISLSFLVAFLWNTPDRSSGPEHSDPAVQSDPGGPTHLQESVVPAEEIPTTSTEMRYPKMTERINQGETVAEDLKIVADLLFSMQMVLKNQTQRPLGTNREFTAALTGNNAVGIALLPSEHPAINESGELVDRFGTPYHFHPLSTILVEIRSAGPDRRLFSPDDSLHSPLSREQRSALLQEQPAISSE